MQSDIQTHKDIAAGAAGFLLVMSGTTAMLMAWLLACDPSLIVSAVSTHGSGSAMAVVLDVLYQAFSTVLQYL